MYLSLLHDITSEPFVRQVKMISCPGHAYFPSNKVDVIVCEKTRFNKIPPGMKIFLVTNLNLVLALRPALFQFFNVTFFWLNSEKLGEG